MEQNSPLASSFNRISHRLQQLSIKVHNSTTAIMNGEPIQVRMNHATGAITHCSQDGKNKSLDVLALDYVYHSRRVVPGSTGLSITAFLPPVLASYEAAIAKYTEPHYPEIDQELDETLLNIFRQQFGNTPITWHRKAGFLAQQGKITFPRYIAPTPLANILTTLSTITGTFAQNLAQFPALKEALLRGDCNKMLRNAAMRQETLPLFCYLLANGSTLGIDLTDSGPTSGTVWDVALKYNNQEALAYLAIHLDN